MEELPFPDLHHARAAEGWLDLGVADEAQIELEKLTPSAGSVPEVLDLYWRLRSARLDWEGSLSIAEKVIAIAPERANGWIHRSYALHELRRTREAQENLLQAVDLFPDQSIIPYNLACYACQLGDLDAARKWLRRALKLKGIAHLREMALDDPDLAPLRSELAQW